MAAVITLPIILGAPPADWKAPSSTGKLSAPIDLPVYPAGPSFISAARRRILKRSFAEDDAALAEEESNKPKEVNGDADANLFPGLGEEKENPSLLQLDAKEWKKQDHYAVLGLGNLRYTANDDHIRVAHRRKVLRHHPDKKALSGFTNDDNYFKCIQKAHEVLTNPEKRRQFDSVDPAIEDFVPSPSKIPAPDFCATYGPVFAREGRFSKAQPVPVLGETDASKKDVEAFYDFWYNFDSWRSFEAYDKEAPEGGDSRDEKRFTEKKNKADRARAKKEDNTRVREMVDMVLAADPRIKRFRQEEKAARDAKKKGGVAGGAGGSKKPMTLAEKKAEGARKAEEEKKAAEEARAEDKVGREAAKKAKEAAKKNLKKWKKSIATVISESNYFQAEGTSASSAVISQQLAELDILVDVLEPEEVKDLKEQVEKAGKGEAAKEAIKAKAATASQKEGGEGKFTEFA